VKRVVKSLAARKPAATTPDVKGVEAVKIRMGANPVTGEQLQKILLRSGGNTPKYMPPSGVRHFFFTELMDADEPRRVDLVRHGLRSPVITEIAEALAVSKATLLGAIGVPVSTMTRRIKSQAKLSPDESDKIDRVAQTFKRAIELFGDEATARVWMSTKLLALGDRTPLELLDSSAGYEMVLNTIGRIAYGAAA
jgi:putative toxin-antitoxin system antitoxin component (TIGR02293 family)